MVDPLGQGMLKNALELSRRLGRGRPGATSGWTRATSYPGVVQVFLVASSAPTGRKAVLHQLQHERACLHSRGQTTRRDHDSFLFIIALRKLLLPNALCIKRLDLFSWAEIVRSPVLSCRVFYSTRSTPGLHRSHLLQLCALSVVDIPMRPCLEYPQEFGKLRRGEVWAETLTFRTIGVSMRGYGIRPSGCA